MFQSKCHHWLSVDLIGSADRHYVAVLDFDQYSNIGYPLNDVIDI